MKTATPERKSSKTLKGQLFGAVSMMLVAAIALGTSTYAWFINNQTVKVDLMQLSVSTSTSLLAAVGKPASVVAYDTAYAPASYTPFKTIITNDDIKGTASSQGGWAKFFDGKLAPASTCDTSIAATAAWPTFFASTNELIDGLVAKYAQLGYDTTADKMAGVGQGSVKHIRLALQGSASDLYIYLGSKGITTIDQLVSAISEAAAGDHTVNGATVAQQAEAIQKALRVAVVAQPVNDSKDAAFEPLKTIVFQFDAGIANVANNVYNTYFNAIDATAGDPDSLITVGTGGAPSTPNITKVGDALGKYPGINTIYAADDTTHPSQIKITSLLTTAIAGTTGSKLASDYMATVTAVTDQPDTVTPGKTPLFKLPANMSRVVDLYIWLEGTDQDCVNTLSSYNFNLAMPFAATTEPATP